MDYGDSHSESSACGENDKHDMDEVTVQPLTIQGVRGVQIVSLPTLKMSTKDLVKISHIPTIQISDGNNTNFGILENNALSDLNSTDSNFLGNYFDGEVLPINSDNNDFNHQYESVRILTVDKPDQNDESIRNTNQLDIKLQHKMNSISSTTANTSKKSNDKIYKCKFPDCNKLYSAPHHLKIHERVHSGDKPYRCTYEDCLKSFSTSYALKSHIRVHTGEKPYKCQYEDCVKCFKTSGDLQKHNRTHTGERPFRCPFEGCDRSFTTSNIRKVHIRTHTGERPYVCTHDNCNRRFASATNFKNHMRIHSGEKPYECTVANCGKKFTEYSSLFKHQVVHTQHKPYACQECGKTYRQTSTLAMHKRTAHSDDNCSLSSVNMVNNKLEIKHEKMSCLPSISFLSAEQAAEAVAAGGALLITQTTSSSSHTPANMPQVYIRVAPNNSRQQYKQVESIGENQIIMMNDNDTSQINDLHSDNSNDQVELTLLEDE